jgi:hypothetical protein
LRKYCIRYRPSSLTVSLGTLCEPAYLLLPCRISLLMRCSFDATCNMQDRPFQSPDLNMTVATAVHLSSVDTPCAPCLHLSPGTRVGGIEGARADSSQLLSCYRPINAVGRSHAGKRTGLGVCFAAIRILLQHDTHYMARDFITLWSYVCARIKPFHSHLIYGTPQHAYACRQNGQVARSTFDIDRNVLLSQLLQPIPHLSY